MTIIQILQSAVQAVTDSNLDPYTMDFFYGPREWQTIDTNNINRDFVYLDPIDGTIPKLTTGFIKEDYTLKFLVGRCISPDSDKEDERIAVWACRGYAKQIIRRLFEQVDSQGMKYLMPFDGATIVEVRKLLATNVYGVAVTMNVMSRVPDETC